MWLFVFTATARPAWAQPAAAPRTAPIRIFLDCNFFCDEDFLKREITFVDYMRDRRDADVHVLVTTQETGGGGTEYTLKFIGLGSFAGVEQTLRSAPQTATADERRKGSRRSSSSGWWYVSEAPQSQRLKVTFSPEEGGRAGRSEGSVEPLGVQDECGRQLQRRRIQHEPLAARVASANRTTDDWRLSFAANADYRSETFQLVVKHFVLNSGKRSKASKYFRPLELSIFNTTFHFRILHLSTAFDRRLAFQYQIGFDSHQLSGRDHLRKPALLSQIDLKISHKRHRLIGFCDASPSRQMQHLGVRRDQR